MIKTFNKNWNESNDYGIPKALLKWCYQCFTLLINDYFKDFMSCENDFF